MPENDIYNSQRKYENFLKNLELFLIPPERRADDRGRKSIYYCKNKNNLKYFRRMAEKFDARDISYVRRCRVLNTLRLICHATGKDLAECDRDDMDKIVAFMHTRYNSPKSKSDFIRDVKCMWRILFSEKDEKGRIDDSICPYPVRHLNPRVDKSKNKARKDKLTWEEYESIINYFADNLSVQSFLTIQSDSYGRPQETLYTRIKDLELHDNWAIIHITEHGKEGPGSLLCIDSYPYLLKWYQEHPLKDNKEAFLFIDSNRRQLVPEKVNDFLKKACRDLRIDKPITCYSFKRNGITFARQRGDSDVVIQHRARWTSVKQLKTYDQTTQDDAFRVALAKRGLIKDEKYRKLFPATKTCLFCGFDKIGFAEHTCPQCKRSVDRDKIKQEVELHNTKVIELREIKNDNQKLKEALIELKTEFNKMAERQEQILQLKIVPAIQTTAKDMGERGAVKPFLEATT